MSNGVATVSTGRNLAALQQMVAFSKTKLNKILKFDGRNGMYSVREEDKDERINYGTRLVVNMLGIKKGYVCWNDGSLVESKEYAFDEPVPSEDDLPDHGPYAKDGDGWKFQFILPMKDMDTNQQYTFTVSSASGTREIGKFFNAVLEQQAAYPIDEYTPVVELQASDWKSKDGHRNFKPVLKIVDWMKNPDANFAPSDIQKKLAPSDTTGDEPDMDDANVPKSRRK